MNPILEVKNLIKHYPKVQAVNGVSFSIREGTCFGLLGPNGAGKTTTIEMIEGITPPTSGGIFFRGEPVGKLFRERSGIQFQHTALPDFLTVREALKLFKSFYPHSVEIESLVELCSLGEFLDRDTHKLSGGQLQRVLLAIALVNDPDIVFLDEPTTGLDPQARRNFWDLIQAIKARKKTVVLTTHYMEEAYILCDEIAIMDHGKIIAQGVPDQLLKKHFDQVSIEVPHEDFKPLGSAFEVRERESEGMMEILTTDVNGAIRAMLDAGTSLHRLRVRPQTLEDLFLHLTGKELRA